MGLQYLCKYAEKGNYGVYTCPFRFKNNGDKLIGQITRIGIVDKPLCPHDVRKDELGKEICAIMSSQE